MEKTRCLWCGNNMTALAKFNKRPRSWCSRTCKSKHEKYATKYLKILLEEGEIKVPEVLDAVNRPRSH